MPSDKPFDGFDKLTAGRLRAKKINRLTSKSRKPIPFSLAEGPGFEPGLTGPEPVVLPLDDPSVFGDSIIYNITYNTSREFWFSKFDLATDPHRHTRTLLTYSSVDTDKRVTISSFHGIRN